MLCLVCSIILTFIFFVLICCVSYDIWDSRLDQDRVNEIMFVLSTCNQMSGIELKKWLKQKQLGTSSGHFYCLMAELEERGMVKGYYLIEEINGFQCQLRYYSMEESLR